MAESVLTSGRMIVRADQMREMQVTRETLFFQRICAELRAQVPERTAPLDDDALLKAVAEAYTKSLGYGISTGGGVRRFVKLAVLVNPKFDEAPDVQRFLRMPDLDPDTKIKLLAQSVAQRLRETGA